MLMAPERIASGPSRSGMARLAAPLALMIALSACSQDAEPELVANRSEAIADNLQARADALEMQAENAADAEVEEAMQNAADDLDDASANIRLMDETATEK
jgi:hypothetical protein